MKKFGLIIHAITALFIFSNSVSIKTESHNYPNNKKYDYDSFLAKQFGADDYGMKKYMFTFLKRGTNENMDSAALTEIQKGHKKNILQLTNEGDLVLAGSFLDSEDLRGIFILNTQSIKESVELKEWYGSAALMRLNELSKKNHKS